jgi:CRP-like cAMP-binding protein
LLSEARHIVAVAYFAILLSQPALVSEAPSHAHGTPYLGIYSEDSFQPVIVALHAFGSIRYIATPYRILDRRRGDIVFEGGETLTEIGEPYHRLLFLLSGEVAVETMADDRGYRIVETIKAPEVFMIERLFGYDQHSPHHYVARNDCSLMSISKKEVLRLAKQYEIFHINLLNLISTQAQRSNRRLFRVPPKTLSDSIIRFFENHCLRPAGEKNIHIKMDRLAQELNVKRLKVSVALNELETQGLIELHRGRISIPALEKLINR